MPDKIKLFFSNVFEKVKTFIDRVKILVNSIKFIQQFKNIFYNFFMKDSRLLIAIILVFVILIMFLVSGCSAGVSVRYYPVSIPVKCNIDMPAKPVFSENILETNMNITKYAEELEAGLKMCRGAD